MQQTIAALLLSLLSLVAHADDAVTVTDMSQLSWQLDTSGKVWLRNLSQFNATFLGCCYNYYIDVNTAEGKAKWSALLAYIATGTPMTLYVSNKNQVGPITFLMN